MDGSQRKRIHYRVSTHIDKGTSSSISTDPYHSPLNSNQDTRECTVNNLNFRQQEVESALSTGEEAGDNRTHKISPSSTNGQEQRERSSGDQSSKSKGKARTTDTPALHATRHTLGQGGEGLDHSEQRPPTIKEQREPNHREPKDVTGPKKLTKKGGIDKLGQQRLHEQNEARLEQDKKQLQQERLALANRAWRQNLEKINEKELRDQVKERISGVLVHAQHSPGTIQDAIFEQPVNSQSKLRKKRQPLLREMERTNSARNRGNPFQDTSDSELDEIESEVELEREYLEHDKESRRPKLQLKQDGDICFYCGAIMPYELRRTTPYPALYECALCQQCQKPRGPLPMEAHESELQELEWSVRFRDEADPYEGKPTSNGQQELMHLTRTPQLLSLSPEQEPLWERTAGDYIESPDCHSILGLSRIDKKAKCLSTGRSLVAGGMVWTAEEGNRFFQGLRRFGKHNVWAIQKHIRSRSLAEVVTMIQTMEMEMERRRHFGLETIRLSEMPMTEVADDKQVEVEEQCAAVLKDRAMLRYWRQYVETPETADAEVTKKTGLFNLRTLADMSSRLYIQNEGASVEREVAMELYDALKEWLTPIVKELVTLHHERHRVSLMLKKDQPPLETPSMEEMDVVRTLFAQQKPMFTDSFFEALPARLAFLAFDDTPSALEQETAGLKHVDPMWVMGGLGKKYYLNEQVDQACAQAPDSDQDMETDDGVSAEEEAELKLDAPLAILRDPLPLNNQELTKTYLQQKLEQKQWKKIWSTASRVVRHGSQRLHESSRSLVPSEGRRFRETHPLEPTLMSFTTWQEGVERLAANSHALPISASSEVATPSVEVAPDNRVQSMNKVSRNHEQRLYLDHNESSVPGLTTENYKTERIKAYVERMAQNAKTAPVRVMDTYAPGYGVLPENASFMHDATRPPPQTGYGLGERDRGGLWLMDKSLHNSASGYITVSDTEDEEEEERGWKRQMDADHRIEREWKRRRAT